MGLLDALKGLVSGGERGSRGETGSEGFFLFVRCQRGHPIRVWVHRSHDLAQDYGESNAIEGYRLTKHVVCPRCYTTTVARVRYDSRYRELEREIEGGSFMTAADYEAEAAPPAGEAR